MGFNNQIHWRLSVRDANSVGTISCTTKDLPLVPGRYFVDLYLGDGAHDIDIVYESIAFEVLPADVFGTGQLPPTGTCVVYWPATFALSDDIQRGEVAEIGSARKLGFHSGIPGRSR